MPNINLELSNYQFTMFDQLAAKLSDNTVALVLAPLFDGLTVNTLTDVCKSIRVQTDYGQLLFGDNDTLTLSLNIEQLTSLKKIVTSLTDETAMVVANILDIGSTKVLDVDEYGDLNDLCWEITQQLKNQGV